MKDKSIFPPLVYQMFAVGESSGTLDEIVEKVSEFYDKEVDNAVKNLSSLIEPIMIVFMGGHDAFSGLSHLYADVGYGQNGQRWELGYFI